MEIEFVNLFPQSIMIGLSLTEESIELFLGLFALSIRKK